VVIRSLRHVNGDVDLSCSSGRVVMGYVIDNFEMFFQKPEEHVGLIRDYISISLYYPVLLVISLPLAISNINGYGDIVNAVGNIPEANKIKINLSPEETKAILSRMGIKISGITDNRIIKTPGLGIRALTSRSKGGDDSVDIIIV